MQSCNVIHKYNQVTKQLKWFHLLILHHLKTAEQPLLMEHRHFSLMPPLSVIDHSNYQGSQKLVIDH